ncbi:MAG: cytochrome c3 family protein [Pirellulales bacterium]
MLVGLPIVVLAAVAGLWSRFRPTVETPPVEEAAPRPKLVGAAVKHPARPGGYVGSQACAECHATIAASYARHPMYRSGGSTPGADDVEDFDQGTEFSLDDGRIYRVVKQEDGIYHHEILRDQQGATIYDEFAKIAYFIGSGARGKSYAIDRGGLLFQSPISWFSSDQKWDMSPGYGHRHVRFGRRILERCVDCHAGRPTMDPEREDYFPEPVLLEAAIGCERCHGPGQPHIEFHASGEDKEADDPIINPAKLSADRREAVCYQCHLIGKMAFPRYGRSFYDFRPGDRLDDVWSTFVAGTGVRGDQKTKAVSHVEQMRDSVCFQKSEGALGCVSCHDAHSVPAKSEVDGYYRQRCLECHAERGCSLPADQQAAPPANHSCTHCHMPRLSAHDIAHASQTDHRILRQIVIEEIDFAAETKEVALFDQDHSTLPEWEIERALVLATVHRLMEAGYASQKEADEAEHILRDIIEIAPDDFASLSALGSVLDLRQDAAGAREVWQRALELKPANEHILDFLVSVCQKSGDDQAALEYLDRLMELNPWRSRDYMRRATLLSQLGRTPEAVAAAERALELDPTDRTARRWIINAAQTIGDLNTARHHAEILRRVTE